MIKVLKGRVFYMKDDPYVVSERDAVVYHKDGALAIENGKILSVGESSKIIEQYPQAYIEYYDENHLIVPGFIDSHIHFPQTEMIGAYGKQLLDWLNNYTFVVEQKFKNKIHSDMVANVFIDELLKNGVTTAVAYGSMHPQSVESLFQYASSREFNMIAGKVMMSRNAPEALTCSPQQSYDESLALIKKWHGKGRNKYAVTPRFAITCPQEELELASALMKQADGLFMQTHLSENEDEIAFTLSLFKERKNYTDIYDRYGLLGKRSLFGHGIHLSEEELLRLSETKSAIIHCPTSNLFLGSGLLNVERAKDTKRPVHIGVASDVGAGTSFSPLVTLNEAYKVAQMQKQSMSAYKAFYLLTLGNARALNLENEIGIFKEGAQADITVLRNTGTSLMQFRQQYSKDLHEELFVHMIIGDDRSIAATYTLGNKVYQCN